MSGAEEPGVEFDRFELVLLKRPAERTEISDEETERIQRLHLDHLARMRADGHLYVAGPFDEQPGETLRGMALYHVGSVERATELAAADPAVLAGRLELEVMASYCPTGAIVAPSTAP